MVVHFNIVTTRLSSSTSKGVVAAIAILIELVLLGVMLVANARRALVAVK